MRERSLVVPLGRKAVITQMKQRQSWAAWLALGLAIFGVLLLGGWLTAQRPSGTSGGAWRITLRPHSEWSRSPESCLIIMVDDGVPPRVGPGTVFFHPTIEYIEQRQFLCFTLRRPVTLHTIHTPAGEMLHVIPGDETAKIQF